MAARIDDIALDPACRHSENRKHSILLRQSLILVDALLALLQCRLSPLIVHGTKSTDLP